MNNDMKCPFCQQELQETYDGKQFWCSNYKDPTHPINMLGTKELWQELIRTRKALDVAIGALKMIGSGDIIEHSVVGHEDDNKIFIANKALEQITALEQKDVK